MPTVRAITVDMSRLAGITTARWNDSANGNEIVLGFEDAIGEPLWLQSGRSPILVPARAKKPHRDAGTQAVWGYIVKILYLAA